MVLITNLRSVRRFSQDKLLRYMVYLRRGHTTYGAIVLQAANFAMLTALLLTNLGLPILVAAVAAILALAAYGATMTVLGWWDYRRGQWQHEAVIAVSTNPAWRAQAKTLIAIAEHVGAETDGVKELRKYVEMSEKRKIVKN